MNKAVALALATGLSTASLGGIAFAQTTSSTTPMAADDMITIVEITEDSDSNDATTQIPEEFRNPSSDVTTKAQAEIQADPALMTALEDKSVELENVVAIDTAANGGKIVYVK